MLFQPKYDKIIEENNLIFELHKSTLTAEVYFSKKAYGDIYIPRSLKYDSNEYLITSIKYNPTCYAKYNIKSINFPEDSAVSIIRSKSLSESSIEKLYIPESIEILEDEWCNMTNKLTNITISPKNKHFSYADESHQIIVSKTKIEDDIYENLIFASRSIKHVFVPKYIKHIKPHAFEGCSKIKTIEFPEDSDLQTIEEFSFCNSSLKEIKIPKSVYKIEEDAFFDCRKLKTFELQECTKLEIFPYGIFSHCTSLKNIIIPEDSSLRIIESDAFECTKIESFIIPKNINKINNSAFYFCSKLKKVEFQEGSLIKSIPYQMFAYCQSLKTVKIPENSSIECFEAELFRGTSIKSIYIPSSINKLYDDWCMGTKNLTKVTISPENNFFTFADKSH